MAGQAATKEDERYTPDPGGQLTFSECRTEDRFDATVPVYIGKSNALIKRIGKTTLLSEQALLIAIYKAKKRTRASIAGTSLEAYYDNIKEKTGSDFAEGLIATFTSTELKKMMNIRTSRYAAAMDELMNLNVFTNSWHIIYNDNGMIGDTACIIASVYDKKTGRVTIKFNDDIADRILNLKNAGGYTMLDTSIMNVVSKDLVTWSIYQLLREEISYREAVQKRKGLPERKEYVTEFGLSEFKFLSTINQVDLGSNDPIQLACVKLLKEKNYEEAERVLPKDERMYDDWRPFRQRVLGRACLTINGWKGNGCYDEGDEEYEKLCGEYHPTDIHFRCEPVKSGVGAKVNAIRFYIRWDRQGAELLTRGKALDIIDAEEEKDTEKPKKGSRKKTPVDKNEFLDSVSDLIEEKMRVSDVRKIAESSGYDIEKVRIAYMKLKVSGGEVSADAIIGMMPVNAASGTTDVSAYRKSLPGFTEEELASMAQEALKHVPDNFEGDEGEWAVSYIMHYRDKALATADSTKTTMYNRLMDMLRKDYDKKASGKTVLPAPEWKRADYSGRAYTEEQIKAIERRKLGIQPESETGEP